jgi:hypothetical protein
MKLNIFEKIKLKIKFYKFFKKKYFFKFPFDLNSFENIVFFLPEDRKESLFLLSFIYNLEKNFKKEIRIFTPCIFSEFSNLSKNLILYDKINYRILKDLNAKIINKKTIIFDFYNKNEFKKYIVKPFVWISNQNTGNLIIKTLPKNIFDLFFKNEQDNC